MINISNSTCYLFQDEQKYPNVLLAASTQKHGNGPNHCQLYPRANILNHLRPQTVSLLCKENPEPVKRGLGLLPVHPVNKKYQWCKMVMPRGAELEILYLLITLNLLQMILNPLD